MYIANDVKQEVYLTHIKTTRKALGISDKFHKVFSDYLNNKKFEIIDSIIAV